MRVKKEIVAASFENTECIAGVDTFVKSKLWHFPFMILFCSGAGWVCVCASATQPSSPRLGHAICTFFTFELESKTCLVTVKSSYIWQSSRSRWPPLYNVFEEKQVLVIFWRDFNCSTAAYLLQQHGACCHATTALYFICCNSTVCCLLQQHVACCNSTLCCLLQQHVAWCNSQYIMFAVATARCLLQQYCMLSAATAQCLLR